MGKKIGDKSTNVKMQGRVAGAILTPHPNPLVVLANPLAVLDGGA
jgi:hypothetical protein